MRVRRGNRRAFTLVELLVVIAIIALLIGIVVPSVQSARSAAKNTATSARIKSLGEGAEAFHNDFNYYPRSSGVNPFERRAGDTRGANYLSGAQWLALQLSGPDTQGYVDPNDHRAEADNTTPGIDGSDWQAWYNAATASKYLSLRKGPYIQAESAWFVTPEGELAESGGRLNLSSNSLASSVGSGAFRNFRLPYFEDYFERPILYYAASLGAKRPFAGPAGPESAVLRINYTPGIYDQTDNAQWTGGDGSTGGQYSQRDEGTSFGLPRQPNGLAPHSLGKLGWYANATDVERNTFADFVMDRKIFDQTRTSNTPGKVVPHNPERFLLISAGKDAKFGTSDDVVNFAR